MSRHTQIKSNISIAYGYDHTVPLGGFFFQVFDSKKISEENDEGVVLNEGFVHGISKERMLFLMEEYGVKDKLHLELVAMDMPI